MCSWFDVMVIGGGDGNRAFFLAKNTNISKKCQNCADGKEVTTEDSKEYTFLPVFSGSLNFEVKAQHNAHISLTGGEADEPPKYEVFLGGWENRLVSKVCSAHVNHIMCICNCKPSKFLFHYVIQFVHLFF